MNVIKQPKSGGVYAAGRGRAAGGSRGRGRGMVAADFNLIQYRPRGKAEESSSNSVSSEMRTPNNLLLQMAISSSARRNSSSSTACATSDARESSSPGGVSAVHQFPGTLSTFRTPSSTSSSSKDHMTSSSGSVNQRKFPSRRNEVTPQNKKYSSMLGTPQTIRMTPLSASSSDNQSISHVVLAITEGRGHARGEVGMAVIDTKRPRLILCQLSDRQTYSNTLTKINVFRPVEILVPHTFVDGNQPNKLYHVLTENFPHISMSKVQRRLFKESEGMEKLQHLALPESASCHLIVKDKFYALAATAALLRYVEFVQNTIFATKSLRVEYQGAQYGTVIDIRTAQALELLLNQGSHTSDYTLVALLDYCCTYGGRRMLRACILHPPCALLSITRRQDSVQELIESQNTAKQIREVLKQIPDVEQLLTLCMQTPSTIDCNQSMETRVNYVLLLKSALDILPNLAKSLEGCQSYLHSKAKKCFEDSRGSQIRNRILETLNEDVKTPKGSKTATFQRCFAVKSGINEFLDVARKTYCELISDMYDHVTQMEAEYSLPLKMNYSVTKGYHIIITPQRNKPVKDLDLPRIFFQVQRSRNSVSCTTDILVHANERIKFVSIEILQLSNTLLTVLLNDIRQFINYLYDMCENIAELDVILALSQISSSPDYVRPKFDDFLRVKSSRHPILESVTTCNPIANDVEATKWSNLSLITGPNMSGKSIFIKQVLLLQIMAQIGCYVPAEEATFRVTDRIFSHLNFDDSIENNASTLSLELQEVHLILSSLTATSLVALDELCRGTTVEEGTSLAWAICEELSQTSAFVFVTTHFMQLTSIASVYPCIKNLHLETLERPTPDGKIRLSYTHRVKPGVNPVKNYGLRLAETFNIPKSILEDAWGIASRLETRSQELVSRDKGNEAYTRFMAFEKLKLLALKEDLTLEELRAAQAAIKAELAAARNRSLEAERAVRAPAPAAPAPVPVHRGGAAANREESTLGDKHQHSVVSSHLDESFCTKSPTGSTLSRWEEEDDEEDDSETSRIDRMKYFSTASFDTFPCSSSGTWAAEPDMRGDNSVSCHSNETWLLEADVSSLRTTESGDQGPTEHAKGRRLLSTPLVGPSTFPTDKSRLFSTFGETGVSQGFSLGLAGASGNVSPADMVVEDDDLNVTIGSSFVSCESPFQLSPVSVIKEEEEEEEKDNSVKLTLSSPAQSEKIFPFQMNLLNFSTHDQDAENRALKQRTVSPIERKGVDADKQIGFPEKEIQRQFLQTPENEIAKGSKRTAEEDVGPFSPILLPSFKKRPYFRPSRLPSHVSSSKRSLETQHSTQLSHSCEADEEIEVELLSKEDKKEEHTVSASGGLQSIAESYAFSDSDCSD